MLDKIKLALRISHNDLDDDIKQNINACLADLERVGVDPHLQRPLLCNAVELYCKWAYDFQGKGEQFFSHYEKLRNMLSLSEEYKAYE